MDLIITHFFFYWLILAVIFLLLEIGNPGLFFFFSFSFGAVAAAVSTFSVNNLYMQIIIFLLMSVISCIFLRYCIVPFLSKGRPHERTNVYALIGKRGFVIQDISKESAGLVKIDGVVWVARPASNQTIYQKTTIEVVNVQGAHVIVKEYTN